MDRSDARRFLRCLRRVFEVLRTELNRLDREALDPIHDHLDCCRVAVHGERAERVYDEVDSLALKTRFLRFCSATNRVVSRIDDLFEQMLDQRDRYESGLGSNGHRASADLTISYSRCHMRLESLLITWNFGRLRTSDVPNAIFLPALATRSSVLSGPTTFEPKLISVHGDYDLTLHQSVQNVPPTRRPDLVPDVLAELRGERASGCPNGVAEREGGGILAGQMNVAVRLNQTQKVIHLVVLRRAQNGRDALARSNLWEKFCGRPDEQISLEKRKREPFTRTIRCSPIVQIRTLDSGDLQNRPTRRPLELVPGDQNRPVPAYSLRHGAMPVARPPTRGNPRQPDYWFIRFSYARVREDRR